MTATIVTIHLRDDSEARTSAVIVGDDGPFVAIDISPTATIDAKSAAALRQYARAFATGADALERAEQEGVAVSAPDDESAYGSGPKAQRRRNARDGQ